MTLPRSRTYFEDPRRADTRLARDKPTTPTQALMEAPYWGEPEESSLELQVRLEGIRDVLEDQQTLDRRELWIIEAHWFRGLSFERISKELCLSKTHTHRIHQLALVKLRDALESAPEGSVAARVFEQMMLW